jgi:hypothetical protein
MTDHVALEREGEEILIRLPMELKRRHGRKEIILPAGAEAPDSVPVVEPSPLLKALARAFAWQEAIEC